MPVYEIEPKPEHGPFRAAFGVSAEGDYGEIRIEPPFTPGSAELIGMMADCGVIYQYEFTDRSSTVLSFYEKDRSVDPNTTEENVHNVMAATELLLASLGRMSDKSLFTKHWEQER